MPAVERVESVSERQVATNGVTLNLAEAGPPDGRPVILLHGFPDSWHLWRHQIAALAGAGYRVLAPDLRGFGRSEKPQAIGDYAMRVLLDDVTGILDDAGVERAAVVGHDWGAGLAWTVATYAPARVERLAAVSVGHPRSMAAAGLTQRRLSWYMLWFLFPGVAEQVLPAEDWAFFRRWAWGSRNRPGDHPDADRQVTDLSRPGALTAGLNWYRANIDPLRYVTGGSGESPPVTCPTLGVWSTHDFALTEQQMTGSERFVTGPWRYERLDGVDHWVPVNAPERLSALLLDFLDTPKPE
jgi:pimeloyl-ACP methyl ester carboxylesterase